MFRYYLAKVSFDPTLDYEEARPADRIQDAREEIEGAVKEAALIATRDGRDMVGMFKDLSQAFERIDLGIAHRLPLTDKERETHRLSMRPAIS